VDFKIDDKTQDALHRMARIVREDVIPLEKPLFERGFFALEGEIANVRQKVKAEDLWAPQLPEEIGGMGWSLVDHGLASEVLGESPLGHYVFGCHAPDAGNAEILHLYGSDEQKGAWLAPLAAGELRSCFSMTEPDMPGSNPVEMSTTARLEGDEWVINGRKWFTTAADGAAIAIVMAVTEDEDAGPYGRASMIIVPTDTEGFRLERNIPIMGMAGEGWASHGEVVYEDCRVPERNLLGGRGAGFLIAQERLGPGRIHHCMRWLGICERAFSLMVERAQTRDMGGGKPLVSKQLVRAWLSESRAAMNAARWMVLHTAWKIDREGFAACREEVSLIKFHVAKVLQEVVDRAVQVHGALGITDDTVLGYFYSHERGARIYDGPDEVHKLAASKRILERYARDA
jgi:alkylation response protein AidB-like acyl-CoA dehydrogenase